MEEEIATYLGAKGYSIKKDNISIPEQELIRKELTVKAFAPKSSISQPTPFPVYRESPKKFYVPRFYGYKTYGEPDEIRISEGENIEVPFAGELRDFQKPIVKKYLKVAKTKGCGLLEIHCGAGKTVMGLKIISELKKKTLVIVHKEFLLEQWKERILQFLPTAKVGRIQGEIIDIEGKDIVIGMLQSLSMKKYPTSIFQQFGLTICDECHHLSAEVFSNALFQIVTKYMLGLSATMKRKDNLSKVFKMFIGDVVYKKERESNDIVTVKGLFYETNDADFSKVEYNFKGQVHYALMIKKLCEFNRRSEFILKVLEDSLKEKPEQQFIILAHNKNILKYLHDAIKHRKIASVGYYVGGMKQKDLKISEEKKVIIATYAMAEEALDIKSLTSLIMATPKSDVRQAVGRILRKKVSTASVYDIVDIHGLFQRQWQKRCTWYRKQKFTIMSTNTEEYKKNQWTTLSTGGKRLKKNKVINTSNDVNHLLQGVCLLD
jgi:superfamily II DNA or RNA helicase